MNDLKEVRVRLFRINKTVVWLSQQMGISQSRLSQFINGYYPMPRYLREKMEEILHNEESKKVDGK